MKTCEEFTAEIYKKRGQKLAQRKRRQKWAAACLPLAVLLILGGSFGAGRLRSAVSESAGSTAYADKAARIPRLLQVGKPAEVKRVSWLDMIEESKKEYYEMTEEEQQEFDESFSEAQRATYIDPEFQAALNDFARDSTLALAGELGENDCYCPLSLYYALALAGSGARNQTEAEFQDALHVPALDWAANQCNRYYRQHYTNEEASQFMLANSLWMDGRCQFSQSFISGAEQDFFSGLFQADFTDPNVGRDMTQWVSENTDGLLEPEFEFSYDTMLALINTVYLRARWGDEFMPENNELGVFTKADGSEVTAEYMCQGDDHGAGYDGESFLRSERYLAGGFRMIFILPDEGVSPQELLSDPDRFEEMFYPREMDGFEVHWRVPKFTIDSEYDLKDTLGKLGLSSAMDGDLADFSGMYDSLPEPYSGLYLSQAMQGVHLAIDEEGMEAAAYTEISMDAAGAVPEKLPILEMNLSRPFLFAIVADDQTTGGNADWAYNGSSILFVGVCGDPTAAGD